MTNPYAPPGESAAELWEERAFLIAANLSNWAYGKFPTINSIESYPTTRLEIPGILCCVTVLCMHELLSRRETTPRLRWYFNLGYVSLLFVLGTLGGAVQTLIAQRAYIDNRNYPGGPAVYLATHYNTPINVFGFACYVVATWLQDGFLVSAMLYNMRAC